MRSEDQTIKGGNIYLKVGLCNYKLIKTLNENINTPIITHWIF